MSLELLYEGKAKRLWKRGEDTLLMEFLDRATAFDGEKEKSFEGKGSINAGISAHLFSYLEKRGIKTHFIERESRSSLLVKRLDIIPVEVVVRNYATGSIVKRLGIKEGTRFEPPLVEFFLKSDELHDPLICREHIELLNLADMNVVDELKALALKITGLLTDYFDERGIKLYDIKYEFGFDSKGEILLGDELSPDVMRLRDREGRVLDKDVFRKDLGDLMEAYRELARRLGLDGEV